MDLFDKLYYFFVITGFLLSTGLLIYTWQFRYVPAARAMIAMLAGDAFWLLTALFRWIAFPYGNVFLERLGYLGIVSVPVAWFAFAVALSGRDHWLSRLRIGLLLIIPTFIFVLAMNGSLFAQAQDLRAGGGPPILANFSPWVILSLVYSYTLILTGSAILVCSTWRSSRPVHIQTIWVVLAALIPLAANVAYMSGIVRNMEDITPVTVAFSVLLFTWSLLRYHIFNLVPVAREAVVDQVSDGVIVVNKQGQVADLNRAAENILSAHLAQTAGKSLPDLLPELRDALDTAGLQVREVSLAAGKKSRVFEVTSAPLFSQLGVLAGHLLVLHDITDRKQVEDGLQEALAREREMNEMKNRFYHYVTHALRTPLGVIQSSSELIENYGAGWSDEKRRLHFSRIYQAIDRLTQLIDQAMDTSGGGQRQWEVLNPEWFDPADFSQKLIAELQHADQNRHAVQFEKSGSDLQACQDPLLLRSVLENLLSNALKFSPPNNPVLFHIHVSPEELVFTVRDHGCGIPAEELAKIGEPFFRGSNVAAVPGNGLGLVIAFRSVKRLGGTLTMDSRENEGTTATVRVPLELKFSQIIS